MRTVDLGNNESVGIGIAATNAGYMALTATESKILRTRRGAERWLARRGYAPDGTRLPPAAPDPDAWLDRLDLD